MIQTFDDLSAYFKTREESVYRRYADRETQLLKKYAKNFKAFSEKSFYKLFDFDTVLLEKDYYTSKEFNSLKTNEGDLTEEAVMEFVNLMKRRLHGEIYYLYLERDPQFETKEKGVGSSIQDETDKDITEARQLLVI